MNALGQRIAELISRQGPISIAQFMTIALHDRRDGYYATKDTIGARGDFVTAPEVSQMFGELLGLWCVQIWHDQGRPSPVRLIELGPGLGTLMSDALRAMRLAPEFLDALAITLIESSPRLRAQQEDKLKDFADRIEWREQFDDTLADRPIFVIANEFFDALPIRQYVRAGQGWRERMVALAPDGSLCFALGPVPADAEVPQDRQVAEPGSVFECSQASRSLTEQIAQSVARRGGGALIIDYGYSQAGSGDTFQAMLDHGPADVLERPGEVDLSAHVDFTALGDAARRAGAAVFGPIGQGEFLLGLGIEARAANLARQAGTTRESIKVDLERLISPDEMGALFKVLAIGPNATIPPPGF